jgi:tripartite-type tricarboxylate transporter receptor subunit TctC
MMLSSRYWRITAPILVLVAAATFPAVAQDVEAFYRGKMITVIVGYPPAGANDVYARLVSTHIGKHIPGNPTVIIKNMPGAGSMIAANYLFSSAPKDGTFLGLLVPTLPLEEALGASAARYKSASFNWIGRMAPAPNITFIMATSQVKTIQDAFTKVAILGATGSSATNAIYPSVLNNVVGSKFTLVQGYKGSAETILAMERGEVEGHSSTFDTLKSVRPDWVKNKTVNIVVQYMLKRHPELPDVPTSSELARNDEERAILRAVSSAAEIGKFVLTTPEVPPERVAALRKAFDAMTKDPAYIEDAEKQRVELAPMPGDELQKIVGEIAAMPPAVVEKVKAVYPLN